MTKDELEVKLNNEMEWRRLIWDELQEIKKEQVKIKVSNARRSAVYGAVTGAIVTLGGLFLKTKV